MLVFLILSPFLYLAFALWLRHKGSDALVPPAIFKSISIYAILIFSFMIRLVMMISMFCACPRSSF